MSEISKTFSPDLFEAFYLVDEEQDGLRLDQFCADIFPSFSRQQIKKKIKDGQVQILERPYPHKASVKVYHKEKVKVFTPRGTLEDEYWDGELIELQTDPDIIFEDEELIVISKPPFMTTHPTGKHLFNCATVYFEHRDKKTIHSVHRLDRETSGVQLLARTPKSAETYTSSFEKDLVAKAYFFISHHQKENQFPIIANERLGSLDDYIPRLFVHCFSEDSIEGKSAQTRFIKIYSNEDFFIGLAFPKTGRQHQIRAHAAHYGLPLLGDKLYNGDPKIFMRFKDEIATNEDHQKMQIPRHALHAIGLKIKSPYSKTVHFFQAPLPLDLQKWIKDHIPELNLKEFQGTLSSIIDKELQIPNS